MSFDPRAGIEVGYNNLVYLRGGIGNFQKIKSYTEKQTLYAQPSLGVGVALSGLRLDLALSRLAVESVAGQGTGQTQLHHRVAGLRV